VPWAARAAGHAAARTVLQTHGIPEVEFLERIADGTTGASLL
jgi:hypothetical protein